jgi:hypothetical protein
VPQHGNINESKSQLKTEKKLTVLGISPKHLDGVQFTMELWKKKANVPTALDVMLDKWLFVDEIILK